MQLIGFSVPGVMLTCHRIRRWAKLRSSQTGVEHKLWIRRSVVRVHPAVPDKLAKYLEIFDAPIVMQFASWWGSTREALRKIRAAPPAERPIDSLRLVSAAGLISRGRPRDRSSQFVRRILFAFDRITSIDAFAIAWAKRTSAG
jgi:hypothetical protein